MGLLVRHARARHPTASRPARRHQRIDHAGRAAAGRAARRPAARPDRPAAARPQPDPAADPACPREPHHRPEPGHRPAHHLARPEGAEPGAGPVPALRRGAVPHGLPAARREGTTTYLYAPCARGHVPAACSRHPSGTTARRCSSEARAGVHHRRRLHLYRITRVKRHATDFSLVTDAPPDKEQLILQTAEGPRGTMPKLQVLAEPLCRRATPRWRRRDRGRGPAPATTLPDPRRDRRSLRPSRYAGTHQLDDDTDHHHEPGDDPEAARRRRPRSCRRCPRPHPCRRAPR